MTAPTVLTDRDHLLRWAWRTYPRTAERVKAGLGRPAGPVVDEHVGVPGGDQL